MSDSGPRGREFESLRPEFFSLAGRFDLYLEAAAVMAAAECRARWATGLRPEFFSRKELRQPTVSDFPWLANGTARKRPHERQTRLSEFMVSAYMRLADGV